VIIQVEVTREFIEHALDAVRVVESVLRDRARQRYGDEVANRGRIVWTARLEVPVLPTERNDR
jgi:predicted RNA methylase